MKLYDDILFVFTGASTYTFACAQVPASGEPMEKVSVCEARKRLSYLLDSVAPGQEIVIVRRGKPAARLIAVRQSGWRGFPDRSALRATLPRAKSSAEAVSAWMRGRSRPRTSSIHDVVACWLSH